MESNITKQKTDLAQVEQELNKIIQLLSEEDPKALNYLKLSGILNAFPPLQKRVELMVSNSEMEELQLAGEEQDPIYEYHILPPYSIGIPWDISAQHAEDAYPENSSPYYRKTSFADRDNGLIHLGVAAGLTHQARYKTDDSYSFGYKSVVEGTIMQHIDLLVPTDRPLIIKVSVEVETPAIILDPPDNLPVIIDTESTDQYADNLSVLVPGGDVFAGLVGITGEFKLNARPFNSRSFRIFLSRFQCKGVNAQGHHSASFTMEQRLELPSGTRTFTLDMTGVLSAYICTDVSDINSAQYGPFALADLRYGMNIDYPLFRFPYYEHNFIDTGSIRIKSIRLRFFEKPRVNIGTI